MPNDNRISAELSAAAVTAIQDAIAVIRTNLPFLISLTNDERRTLPRLEDNRLALDEDAHALMGRHPEFVSLPSWKRTGHCERNWTTSGWHWRDFTTTSRGPKWCSAARC